MKLNKLGFRKVDVDPNDILHKKEMKEILGGEKPIVCIGYTDDGVFVEGLCAGSSVGDCKGYCITAGYNGCSCA